jgi:glycosyltransferase involved in cell wall biosynthesis
MSRPFFSLIVPTVDRTTELGRLFRSLDRSTCKDLECIVVDQNQDDRLREVLSPFNDRYPIRHLQVNFRGAARARNYGARHAIGTVLNFPDDDCEVTPMVLEDVKRRLTTEPIKVLAGMCIDRGGEPSTTRFALDERPLTAWSMWRRFIEFAMFFDRATFLRAGGYDEHFGVGAEFGSDEGAELLIRLLRELAPGEAHYSHTLRFYHPDKAADCSPEGAARAYSYARGSGALLAKWPTAPVILYSARVFLGAAAATVICAGARRRLYLRRMQGFVSGFRGYRTARRTVTVQTLSGPKP